MSFAVWIVGLNYRLALTRRAADCSLDVRMLMEIGYLTVGGRDGILRRKPLNKGAPVKATSLRETWARFLYSINKAPHEAGLF